jgi:molybdenum cofactor cytidylyltransferase
MGRPKLLLPWGATTILGHLIGQWEKVGARQIGVVCAANSELQAELARLGASESQIINPFAERGMFSSVRWAAGWTGWKPELTLWAVALGDQPHIGEETLRRILEASASSLGEVCQPRQGGHRRHPVILPKEVFKGMADCAAENLKEYLSSQKSVFCDLDDPALGLDIDRMEDYERAKEMYFGTEGGKA